MITKNQIEDKAKSLDYFAKWWGTDTSFMSSWATIVFSSRKPAKEFKDWIEYQGFNTELVKRKSGYGYLVKFKAV